MTTSTDTTQIPAGDELHPGGAERPSEAAMREAAQHDAPVEAPAPKPKRTRRAATSTTSKPKAAAKKAAAAKVGAVKPKTVSARDAVAKVLADGTPRSSKEITTAAAKLATGLTGKTPEASIRALLSTQAKRDDGLVVPGPDKGTYRLRQG